jgi:hypothetical protein
MISTPRPPKFTNEIKAVSAAPPPFRQASAKAQVPPPDSAATG